MTFGGNDFNDFPENQLIQLLEVIYLTFYDTQIDFNDTQFV